jgi:hypothetical protein
MRFLILVTLLCLHLSTLAQFKESDFHCRRDSVISQTTYGSVYLTKDINASYMIGFVQIQRNG